MYAKLLDMRELKPEKGVELAMSDKRRITAKTLWNEHAYNARIVIMYLKA